MKLRYDLKDYQAIFLNYDLPLSKAMRSLFFCDTLLANFTLSKTTKEKTELKPWYIDTFFTPHEKLIQEYLLPLIRSVEVGQKI